MAADASHQPLRLSHARAVALMVLCALLWSTAGVVSRQLESARGFEVTFWRSAFNALTLILVLGAMRGPRGLWSSVTSGGRALWISSVCWCVMYTAFMMALTLTTVANVLVTMALAPLFTALGSRLVLKHPLPWRTWVAIVIAGCGIAGMYLAELTAAEPRHLIGVAVALGVPIAAATNWTLLQHEAARKQAASKATASGSADDMLTAVLLGALLSAILTLPMAAPLQASASDVGWLALLGAFQLAVPCLLAVIAARTLKAPEAALLSLLEVLFGVAWAWLGTAESPSLAVLSGGALVLGALAVNQVLALREHRDA
jgi:drug/metabolite transporter (DMT)-like permease